MCIRDSTHSGEAFGIFAGTAVNDTSSVTAAAATWDGLYNLGTQTLDKAVTVKLTRTLAIIPITLVLSYLRTKKQEQSEKVELKKNISYVYFVFRSCKCYNYSCSENGSRCESF